MDGPINKRFVLFSELYYLFKSAYIEFGFLEDAALLDYIFPEWPSLTMLEKNHLKKGSS